MSLPTVMRKLQRTEGILKNKKGIHMIIKSSSSSSTRKNKNNFKNTKYGKSKAWKCKSEGKTSVFFMARRVTKRRNNLTTWKKKSIFHSLLLSHV